MQSVTSSDGILQIHSANERGPCASLWLPDRSEPGSLTTWWTCLEGRAGLDGLPSAMATCAGPLPQVGEWPQGADADLHPLSDGGIILGHCDTVACMWACRVWGQGRGSRSTGQVTVSGLQSRETLAVRELGCLEC